MTVIVDDFIAPVCLQDIEILYQDTHLLLINKPCGLLSLSGKNPLNRDSVHFRLVKEYSTATMVHRLDFGTSGIMLIALTKDCNAALTKQFQSRKVAKSYVALLQGHVENSSGQINSPIAKDRLLFPKVKICSEFGKPATTRYKVLARYSDINTTRVQFEPLSGRTHQLRIHSQNFGHPILGCDLYGTADSHAAADRLMLHAEKLAFIHPVTNQPICGYSSVPF
ncbi:RluA family pseudouridine synthase [Aliiglaciecola lipolytica]|uniref:tRNA pseudouridine32 synthase n=1 Tax=Aliiglaciecola lipolytica E3 TaxID=1127673 RepID=K6YT09_9ALTE|nr:tRNA pseudouridine32 synthase [Aliiglaciecola lipolytica E3]